VIDAATGSSPEQQAATEFFTTAARNIQNLGAAAGVRRIVTVSIIGCDRFVGGYGAAKAAHEQAALAGPVEAVILRAAQFHEFVQELVDWGRQGDVAYVPEMRTQLVAARSVAEALVDLATTPEPLTNDGPFPEIAGPREENLVEMARLLVAHQGENLRIKALDNPDDPDRELSVSGGLLPGARATLTGPSFAEWLQTRTPVAAS
jgi:uncharacterized protein YbjT (DUF2867 family)